jgi:hypothetical protein
MSPNRSRWRSRWFVLRARIAIVAILIQALVPFLVAAEIDSAVAGGLPICSVAKELNHEPTSDPAADQHKSGGIGTCPICTALHASVAAVTPIAAALPLPSEAGSLGAARRQQRILLVLAVTPYRSRAPPIG